MNHTEDRLERRAHAMIATMDQAPHPADERREAARRRMLRQGTLHVDGGEGCRDIVLYTRDVTEQGVGFLAAGELQPHARGTLELPGPAGERLEVVGELVRARPLASGWHEGYVRFETPVQLFSNVPIRAA